LNGVPGRLRPYLPSGMTEFTPIRESQTDYEGLQLIARTPRPFRIGERAAHFDTMMGNLIDVLNDPSRARRRDPDVSNRMRQDLQILGTLQLRQLYTAQRCRCSAGQRRPHQPPGIAAVLFGRHAPGRPQARHRALHGRRRRGPLARVSGRPLRQRGDRPGGRRPPARDRGWQVMRDASHHHPLVLPESTATALVRRLTAIGHTGSPPPAPPTSTSAPRRSTPPPSAKC